MEKNRKNKKIFKKIFCFEKFLHIKYEKVINKNSKNLLCKLYNKVFLVFKTRINIKCSALTGAGISLERLLCIVFWKFRPHRGGYIVNNNTKSKKTSVPPSQGRVCHLRDFCDFRSYSSALTRAGMSNGRVVKSEANEFRHHKGGYKTQHFGFLTIHKNIPNKQMHLSYSYSKNKKNRKK